MRVSPLKRVHQQAEASFAAYGPGPGGSEAAAVEVVETFGELELEYAALRKSCILLDRPQRALIEVTGSDRIDFLNRMITQELKGLLPYEMRTSFWLNRKGRIDADLRVICLPTHGGRVLLDVDVLALERTLKGLDTFIITEDVQLTDASETTHRLALHGPAAVALLKAVSRPVDGPSLADLRRGQATLLEIAGHEIVVDRDDSAGEVGLELTVPAAATEAVYIRLVETGQGHDGESTDASGTGLRGSLRPAGWHAYNIARIEAGTPLYYIDFGPSSLPHETGVIRERVSFTKGCYLGQEVVARMESRGHSKGCVVGLRFSETQMPGGEVRLPVAGAQVWSAAAPDADPIGTITSSTLSPMLGSEPIAFAMVKHDFVAPGSKLLVMADDQKIPGTVQAGLAFWKRA